MTCEMIAGDNVCDAKTRVLMVTMKNLSLSAFVINESGRYNDNV